MIDILLIIHLLLALAMIGSVLLQRSEGGALGIGGGGGGGGGMSGFLTGRGTANLLTRTTAILAACFICTSLVLTILTSAGSQQGSIVDDLSTVPLQSGEQVPAEPTGPAVPVQ